jgi:hypothetical protein
LPELPAAPLMEVMSVMFEDTLEFFKMGVQIHPFSDADRMLDTDEE